MPDRLEKYRNSRNFGQQKLKPRHSTLHVSERTGSDSFRPPPVVACTLTHTCPRMLQGGAVRGHIFPWPNGTNFQSRWEVGKYIDM